MSARLQPNLGHFRPLSGHFRSILEKLRKRLFVGTVLEGGGDDDDDDDEDGGGCNGE